MNKDTDGKRIEYLDTARGILIILVVLGHTLLFSGGAITEPYSYLMKAIYSFHMMAFFLISSFLFNKDKWCESTIISFCKNRALRLMVPYLFFETIGAVVHSIFNWGNPESFLMMAKNIFTQQVYVGADWYLPTLFVGELLLYVCCKYLHRSLNITVAVVGIIAIALGQDHINSQILCIFTRIILCISLLLIGFYVKAIFLSKKPIWCLLGACMVWLACSQLNRLTFLHAPIIGNVFLFLLAGFCGTYFILGISERIHAKLLKYLGNNTLPIMGTHQNIEYLISYFWGTSTSAIFIIVSFLLMFIPQFAIVPLLNKICPFLIGKPRGNNKASCK